MSTDWSSWIGATAAGEVKNNFGSYSVLTSSGLRMISVNTNFWYKVCHLTLRQMEKMLMRSVAKLLAV